MSKNLSKKASSQDVIIADRLHLPGGSYSMVNVHRKNNRWNVTKKCRIYNHRDKDIRLIREMEFMASLTGKAKTLFPEVYDNRVENDRVYYTIAYIPYKNFSEVIRSGECTAFELSNLLATIYDRLLEDLYHEIPGPKNALQRLDYIPLTIDRLKETRQQLPDNHFLQTIIGADQLMIDGVSYPGVTKTLRRAQSFLEHEAVPATFNHGDLIFQDMLVDPVSKDFCLVDPNGDSVGYMYDIAKTLLCLETSYDMFYHGEYSLETDLSNRNVPEITIRLDRNEHLRLLEAMRKNFWQYLTDHKEALFSGKDDWQRLLLVLCGLQNLAIVMFHTLHHNKHDRATAFLANGIKSINNALDG
ncbi:MAG TPA: hypothetical protein VFZ58_00195 [Candidatus Saccharimonadales bacterium]